ncbi:glutathione S-transferase [Pseudomonas sp. GD03858]|uniref:glutathione S-transferase family protein n=1 Tax=unclassified Pseudomonas TaxID=196821 RepID=UPI00244A1F09|nr:MULTISPECIES: glutathione S-transferase [unclassified Pseudomonas]MDH0647970.1 glutathione S-transferase [Pseudomonas sp. GD03867]MDH0662807.1 glutathione S-transferase [Pseudomonas sp. GD03858]
MLKILGKASSINVRKVLWTCVELNLPFQREDWGSGFQPTDSPQFLALNPNAMVPVIVEGDFVLWESNTILRYLANQHGGAHLYPSAPRARAAVDQWLDWQATDLNDAWRYPFMSLVRRSPAHQDSALLASTSAQWAAKMRLLEQRLQATGAYVAGDTFSLADVAIGLSLNRWYRTPLEHPVLPALAAYHARLRLRPGFLEHGDNGTA